MIVTPPIMLMILATAGLFCLFLKALYLTCRWAGEACLHRKLRLYWREVTLGVWLTLTTGCIAGAGIALTLMALEII